MHLLSEFLFCQLINKKELLKDLLRGDGSVTTKENGKSRSVCLVTTSPKLKDSIQWILLRLGILSGISNSASGTKRKHSAFTIAPASHFQTAFFNLFDIKGQVMNKKNMFGGLNNRYAIVPIVSLKKSKI